MEPVTHALASLSLGRAGLNRVTRFATPMLLVSGLAADLDWLSYWGGPRAFLASHRTAGHSLVGSVAIAASTAAVFAWFARGGSHGDRQTGRVPDAKADGGVSFGTARWGGGAVPFRFWRALAVCGAGAGSHLVLDLTNSYGVKLCWPFSAQVVKLHADTKFRSLIYALICALRGLREHGMQPAGVRWLP